MHGVLCMIHASVIFLFHVRVADMSQKACNWMHVGFNKQCKVFPCTLSSMLCVARKFEEEVFKLGMKTVLNVFIFDLIFF